MQLHRQLWSAWEAMHPHPPTIRAGAMHAGACRDIQMCTHAALPEILASVLLDLAKLSLHAGWDNHVSSQGNIKPRKCVFVRGNVKNSSYPGLEVSWPKVAFYIICATSPARPRNARIHRATTLKPHSLPPNVPLPIIPNIPPWPTKVMNQICLRESIFLLEKSCAL